MPARLETPAIPTLLRVATALVDIEPRLRKVMGYRHLSRLREALQRELKIDKKASKTKAA